MSCICRYDEHVHDRFPTGDPSKRAFTYFVLTSGRFVYASALRLAVLKLILSMTVSSTNSSAASFCRSLCRRQAAQHRPSLKCRPPSSSSTFVTTDRLFQTSKTSLAQATKDVLAMAALEVDLSKIEMGQTVTVKWRGKPVFVRRRSEQEVEAAGQVDLKELRDPELDSDRATNPEVSVCRSTPYAGCHLMSRRSRHQSKTGWCSEACSSMGNWTLRQTWSGSGGSQPCVACSAVAGGGGRVHAPGLRAAAQRRRLARLVLPLPRQPLRHFWPRAQGPSAVQPGGSR